MTDIIIVIKIMIIRLTIVIVKALHTEPSKSQYSISPLVLVILKSPTPTVVDTTLVTLVITILPLVITISPLNNPTCTNGRCKLL